MLSYPDKGMGLNDLFHICEVECDLSSTFETFPAVYFADPDILKIEIIASWSGCMWFRYYLER